MQLKKGVPMDAEPFTTLCSFNCLEYVELHPAPKYVVLLPNFAGSQVTLIFDFCKSV